MDRVIRSEPPRAPSEMDLALVDVVERALGRLGDEVAVLTTAWGDTAGMWFVETTPVNDESAAFSAAFDGNDLVTITVGKTWFEVFPIERVDDLAYIGEIASSVFNGQVVEDARGGSARLALPDGRVIGIGTPHLPLLGKLRRTRMYAPYLKLQSS